ncbi:MAG: endonuclease III [Planctomycetota bacterium]
MGKTKRRNPSIGLLAKLAGMYPESRCALDYENPLQLLVATILSAQCTDARVNKITPALFARFPDAKSFSSADLAEIEELIQSTGFFRNKAANIRGCCRELIDRHGGEVPRTLEELVVLPGVGRKTANVVLGHCFGVPGITVDTHVGRLSRRLGLTRHDDPVKVERDLMEQWPPGDWTITSLRLIDHGRAVCAARKPACDRCGLADLCPRVGVEGARGRTRRSSQGSKDEDGGT